MPNYFHETSDGTRFVIEPAPDGYWCITANGDHIITSTSPQKCIDLIINNIADMDKPYDKLREQLPYYLSNWKRD